MLFNKLGSKATIFFNKVGKDAAQIGKKISTGASGALGGIGYGANYLSKNKILNDLTDGKSGKLLSGVGVIANDLGYATNYKNYHGGLNKVSNQLEKNLTKAKNDSKTVFTE